MIVGITISNSQVYLLGFLSKKHYLQFLINGGIYSVGKEFGKTSQLFVKQKLLRILHGMTLLAKHSRN